MSLEDLLLLVVDDEEIILRMLKNMLELAFKGCQVIAVNNGKAALDVFKIETPDIVLLDVMMPGGINGNIVCRRIREFSQVPIIMNSGYLGLDKEALASGADDFVYKPFTVRGLEERIKSLLNRTMVRDGYSHPQFHSGNLDIDFIQCKVYVNNQEVYLGPTEYKLLSYLANNAEKILTSNYLLEKVWGKEYIGNLHILRMNISRLRRKLGDNPIVKFAKQRKRISTNMASVDLEMGRTIMAATAHSLKGEFLHIGSSVREIQELAGSSNDIREECEVIKRSLEYSQLLLRRLLDYLDLGKTSKASSTNALEVLNKAEELTRPRLPSNIQMEILVDDSVKEQSVSGDTEQITLVLMELISNAINALRISGGIIRLQLKKSDNEVTISVKDNGSGIPNDVQKKLFKEQVLSNKGLGLGLFLCDKIIKALGGKLKLESFPGQGTTATILLPISGDKEEF